MTKPPSHPYTRVRRGFFAFVAGEIAQLIDWSYCAAECGLAWFSTAPVLW